MRKLLKRALAVLESYNAEEFVRGAEVMRDIRTELEKPEPEPEPAYWLCDGKLATSKQFFDFHYPNLKAIPLYFGEAK